MFRACVGFLGRRVEYLDRRHSNLERVPEDVYRHQRRLLELYLDSNRIKDLPKNFFSFSKLTVLSLSDNFLVELPEDIRRLTTLVELDISKNNIEDLPDSIKYCKSLTGFDCSENPLSKLPDGFTQLVGLTRLRVNDTSVTVLPHEIGRLRKLESLEARENLLTYLPVSISYLEKLVTLDLGGNELEELPPSIGNLGELVELWLDSNKLKELPVEIGALDKLKYLDVSVNNLESLPDEIDGLSSLSSLYLSQNNLDKLPATIGKLQNLELLKVDYNRLTELTPEIAKCSNLSELMLLDNLLEFLPAEIGNLEKLTLLNVDHNRLGAIPPEITTCSSLGILSLRDNLLTRLPSSMGIGSLSNLHVLDVVNNRLKSLPNSFQHLHLTALWLTENQSKSLIPLQEDSDPETGEPVLMCFLLPQSVAISSSKENLLLDDGASSVLAEQGNVTPIPGGGVEFGTLPHRERDETSSDEGVTKLMRKPTPYIKEMKDAKTRYVKTKHHMRNINAELFSSVDNPSFDHSPHGSRRSTGSIHSGDEGSRSRSADAGSTGSGAEKAKNDRRSSPRPSPRIGGGVKFSAETVTNERSVTFTRMDTPHHLAGVRIVRKEEGENETEGKKEIASNDEGKVIHRQDTPFVLLAGTKAASMEKPSREALAEEEEEEEEKGQKVNLVKDPLDSRISILTETIELQKYQGIGFGIRIAGGIDMDPAFEGADHGIYVTHIQEGGLVHREGKLKVGDKLIEVNGVNLREAEHKAAVDAIQSTSNICKLKIERKLMQATLEEIPKEEISAQISLESVPEIRLETPTETTFEVVIEKQGRALGMSVIGGRDLPAHPFRNPVDPGIFVSRIVSGGLVDQIGKICIGDRILKVDGNDVENVEHDDAVKYLKESGNTVRLLVKKEPTPAGRKEVLILKKANEKLGMSIKGGIGGQPGNPHDPNDDGIFITKITPGTSAAASGELRVGQKILSVNRISMAGISHNQAVQLLREAENSISIVVCPGYEDKEEEIGRPGLVHHVEVIELPPEVKSDEPEKEDLIPVEANEELMEFAEKKQKEVIEEAMKESEGPPVVEETITMTEVSAVETMPEDLDLSSFADTYTANIVAAGTATAKEIKESPKIATAQRVEARIQLKRVIESDDDDDSDLVSPTSQQRGLHHVELSSKRAPEEVSVPTDKSVRVLKTHFETIVASKRDTGSKIPRRSKTPPESAKTSGRGKIVVSVNPSEGAAGPTANFTQKPSDSTTEMDARAKFGPLADTELSDKEKRVLEARIRSEARVRDHKSASASVSPPPETSVITIAPVSPLGAELIANAPAGPDAPSETVAKGSGWREKAAARMEEEAKKAQEIIDAAKKEAGAPRRVSSEVKVVLSPTSKSFDDQPPVEEEERPKGMTVTVQSVARDGKGKAGGGGGGK